MSRWRLSQQAREWQAKALREWAKAMRGVVSVVTGGGKTYFALMCIVEFLSRCPEGVVLIVVPTTALLDQWLIGLQVDLGVDASDIAVFSGEEKADRAARINLLIINTARETVTRLSSQRPQFLIVDECHRAGSPANARVLQGEHAACLGLSATPVREYDDGFETSIAPALGPVIFEYDYEDALQDGVITPFELVNVKVDLLPDEAARYEKLSKQIAQEAAQVKRGGRSEDRLKRLLQARGAVASTAAMRVPLAAKLADLNRGQRTLIFHERLAAATRIAEILAERDHSVALYHTGIGPAVRRNNLKLYRQGLFDVLVTCRALDEGLNVPETTTAVIASSTASQRQRIQRLGRVLRPAPGKPFSTIYSVYATDVEERRLLREAQALLGVATITWQHGTVQQNG